MSRSTARCGSHRARGPGRTRRRAAPGPAPSRGARRSTASWCTYPTPWLSRIVNEAPTTAPSCSTTPQLPRLGAGPAHRRRRPVLERVAHPPLPLVERVLDHHVGRPLARRGVPGGEGVAGRERPLRAPRGPRAARAPTTCGPACSRDRAGGAGGATRPVPPGRPARTPARSPAARSTPRATTRCRAPARPAARRPRRARPPGSPRRPRRAGRRRTPRCCRSRGRSWAAPSRPRCPRARGRGGRSPRASAAEYTANAASRSSRVSGRAVRPGGRSVVTGHKTGPRTPLTASGLSVVEPAACVSTTSLATRSPSGRARCSTCAG